MRTPARASVRRIRTLQKGQNYRTDRALPHAPLANSSTRCYNFYMSEIQDKPPVRIGGGQVRENSGLLALLQPWRLVARKSAPVDELRLYRKPRWRKLMPLFICLIPSISAGIYLAFLASDRYVSETSFVVRTASKPAGSSGFGAFLQMAGFSRSDDDVFSVQDFLGSRDAIDQLSKKLPLRDFYSRAGADYLMRYPSLFYGGTNEEFYKYIKMLIDVTYNNTTGITTLTVQAFRPEDAFAIASTVLALAEDKVNELNARVRGDAVRVASEEVKRSETRLTEAMVQITDFQNKELMIDPAKNSAILSELIGHLGADLADTQSRQTEKETNSPNGPGVAVLKQRAAALQSQIQAERDTISGDSSGLADKLSTFERFSLERDFAKQALNHSLETLDVARTEARRQQLFLELVVSPNRPDYPTMPARAWTFATILVLNLIGLMILWLFRTGLQEHAQIDE
jgi:capsular polysaccharide transport system permease protein